MSNFHNWYGQELVTPCFEFSNIGGKVFACEFSYLNLTDSKLDQAFPDMTSDIKDYSKKYRAGNDQALAKQIVFALSGAYKKINLYPTDHVIYNTALKSLYQLGSDFFEAHGNLELEIDRNQVRYNGHVVFKEDMSAENPAFIMFRDGINRIEFKITMALLELHEFLEILKNNQILTEESETDIVTDLWEKHFHH